MKRHFKVNEAEEAIEISNAYEAENQKRKLLTEKSIVYKIIIIAINCTVSQAAFSSLLTRIGKINIRHFDSDFLRMKRCAILQCFIDKLVEQPTKVDNSTVRR